MTAYYTPGERVKVTVIAPVVKDDCPNRVSVQLHDFGDDPWIIKLPTNMPAVVRIERVAPSEWPPQPGDVWRDGNGNAWFMTETATDGDTYRLMIPAADSRRSVEDHEFAQIYGPVSLAYREGWQPAPQPVVELAAPVEEQSTKKRRAILVAGLRDLADWMEGRTDLPQSPGWSTHRITYYVRVGTGDAAGIAEVERIAALIGEPVQRDEYAVWTELGFGSVSWVARYVLAPVAEEEVSGDA